MIVHILGPNILPGALRELLVLDAVKADSAASPTADFITMITRFQQKPERFPTVRLYTIVFEKS